MQSGRHEGFPLRAHVSYFSVEYFLIRSAKIKSTKQVIEKSWQLKSLVKVAPNSPLVFADSLEQLSPPNVRKILSLDGGGVRGLSSLLILREIMNDIEQEVEATDVVKPAEYFDLIGGTSTGGLIAIMLGTLGMVLLTSRLC
jgi:hypothetical protein